MPSTPILSSYFPSFLFSLHQRPSAALLSSLSSTGPFPSFFFSLSSTGPSPPLSHRQHSLQAIQQGVVTSAGNGPSPPSACSLLPLRSKPSPEGGEGQPRSGRRALHGCVLTRCEVRGPGRVVSGVRGLCSPASLHHPPDTPLTLPYRMLLSILVPLAPPPSSPPPPPFSSYFSSSSSSYSSSSSSSSATTAPSSFSASFTFFCPALILVKTRGTEYSS
ncbi:hypothetical protein E2C01_036850 [Portunus trituberculatus]|uniref:Uncharacterized protein n=1 Tax=Portunus trituberculatus TaxID=210409 RepID=A0A5B7F6J2_PORTR|nr:hypothetical protein [Portunus trituberculatus]